MYLVMRDDDILYDRYDCNGSNSNEVIGLFSTLDKAREKVLEEIYNSGMLNWQYRSHHRENLGWYFESTKYFIFVPRSIREKTILNWDFEGSGYDEWHIHFGIYEIDLDQPFSNF